MGYSIVQLNVFEIYRMINLPDRGTWNWCLIEDELLVCAHRDQSTIFIRE